MTTGLNGSVCPSWVSQREFDLVSEMSPGTDFPSPEEIRAKSRALASAVFEHYDTLFDIAQRHEGTIQKRWAKKTRAQRLRILLAVWPNMPRTHRPDMEAFRNKIDDRVAYLWPHLNQEDLSKPRPFLLLVKARARNPPYDFVGADSDAMHIGRVTRKIMPPFLNEHVLMLAGVTDRESYGKLLSWDDHPDAFTWLHSCKQFNPGEGLLVLEAQVGLLDFLVRCCQTLLHDISPDRLLSDAYPVVPEPPTPKDETTTLNDSLVVLKEEVPYRVPQAIDLDRVHMLLQARLSAAEDHYWALREDPGYFVEQYDVHKEHRHEMIPDTDGKAHPLLSRTHQHLFNSRVVFNTIFSAYMLCQVYRDLVKQCEDVQRLLAKYADVLSPLEDLPEPFLDAMLKFHHGLKQGIKGPISLLKQWVPSSAPLRKYYVRQPARDLRKISLTPKTEAADDDVSYLLYLFGILWDDQQSFLFTIPIVVDEIGRLIQGAAKDNVSNSVAELVGDLSILSECLRQLETFYPWSREFDYWLAENPDAIEIDFRARSKPWEEVHALLHESKPGVIDMAKLGNPAHGRFQYPLGRRSKENVDKLRQAEANLDELWAKVDAYLGHCSGWPGLSRPLVRTPEWKPPSKPAAPSVRSVPLPVGVDIAPSVPPPTLPPKAKVKTRGLSVPDAPQQLKIETAHIAPAPQLLVDARALRVFRVLYFQPNTSDVPGEVPWNDFVHAMSSVGFRAEKLYGSVWQFEPTSVRFHTESDSGPVQLHASRPILFHEPHPAHKIPFYVARRMGRRLTRAYQWTGETFALVPKNL